jgi:protein TonB
MSRAEQANLAKLPEPTQAWAEFVTPEDYPPMAILARSTGVASVRVTVAPDGTPSDCQTVETSSSVPLDEVTCDVALRARYKPGLDKAGNPVRSITVVRIHWNLS